MNKIQKHSSAKETSAALALHLRDKINSSKIFFLAISGGSTPKMLFEALVDLKEDIVWSKIQLFWVDERCVSPDHEESNYLMTHKSLLSKVDLPSENIHRMKGELEPKEGLKEYQLEVESLPKRNNMPQFDLVILGMGDDGHTASIFPPYKELITIESDLAVGENPYSGQKRLTLTGRTIKNAKELIFHVTGENKANILAEILEEKGNYKDYPSYYFKGNQTTWWVDAAALK